MSTEDIKKDKNNQTPGAAPMFDLEAALLDLFKEQNPWEFLKGVENRVKTEERHRFLDQFYLLVAGREKEAERDNLIAQGRDIFKYRTDTARADVERLRGEGAAKVKVVPGVWLPKEGIFAEMVYNPDHPTAPIQFAVYKDGVVEYRERIKVGDVTYLPIKSKLIEKGVPLLPSGVEEYGKDGKPGTDEDLFEKTQEYLTKYVYFPKPELLSLCASYIFLTWVYDRFYTLPYLRWVGEKGTGKSTALQTIGSVCFRAIPAAGGTTPSPMFRLSETYKGTFILDEADLDRSDASGEIIKYLNVGYRKGALIYRSEGNGGDGFDVRGYDAYCPKILAGRERFRDLALEDRCFKITTERTTNLPRQIPRSWSPAAEADALKLRNMFLLYRFRNYDSVAVDDSLVVQMLGEGVEPRVEQIFAPALAVMKNPALRAVLIAHARSLGAEMLEDRRDSFYGRLLGVIAEQLTIVEAVGHRRVAVDATRDKMNEGRPPHEWVTSQRVGKAMSQKFKFKNLVPGGNRPGLYEVDRDLFHKLMREYGLPVSLREPIT